MRVSNRPAAVEPNRPEPVATWDVKSGTMPGGDVGVGGGREGSGGGRWYNPDRPVRTVYGSATWCWSRQGFQDLDRTLPCVGEPVLS